MSLVSPGRAVDRTRIPAGLAHLIHRALAPDPCAGDPRLAETRGTSRTVYGILGERHTAECQEGISRDTQALMGGTTRSSVMGKIIAVPAGQDKNSWLFDPQTSAACPRTSPDVQLSLRIRILHLGVFRWTNPNGGQMVVRPIAKLSKEAWSGPGCTSNSPTAVWTCPHDPEVTVSNPVTATFGKRSRQGETPVRSASCFPSSD